MLQCVHTKTGVKMPLQFCGRTVWQQRECLGSGGNGNGGVVTPHQWQLPKNEIHPKNTSVHCPCCCCLTQQFAGWLWRHLCGPSCPNAGMQTCVVPPVLVLQPQWHMGWTPRCQMSCTIHPLPGVKAWLPFFSHFFILGGRDEAWFCMQWQGLA